MTAPCSCEGPFGFPGDNAPVHRRLTACTKLDVRGLATAGVLTLRAFHQRLSPDREDGTQQPRGGSDQHDRHLAGNR